MSLINDISTIARGCGVDLIDHAMTPVNRSPRTAATEPRPRVGIAQEGSSPCADARTASVSDSQYRVRIYAYERLIEQLYDLARAERFDELHDVVRAEYLAIHGPRA